MGESVIDGILNLLYNVLFVIAIIGVLIVVGVLKLRKKND